MNRGDALFTAEYSVQRADLVAYAAASGDSNPIHLDEAAARDAGLDDVIAHGMYTMGLAARAVAEWAGGPQRVEEFTARFARPVLVPADGGADVVVGGSVRGVRDDGRVEVNLIVTCGGEKVLAPARAVVKTPQ